MNHCHGLSPYKFPIMKNSSNGYFFTKNYSKFLNVFKYKKELHLVRISTVFCVIRQSRQYSMWTKWVNRRIFMQIPQKYIPSRQNGYFSAFRIVKVEKIMGPSVRFDGYHSSLYPRNKDVVHCSY